MIWSSRVGVGEASRFASRGSTDGLGDIDPTHTRDMDFLHAHRIHVVDMTGLTTEDGVNHGKFAESPEVIRLIGRQLAIGQPIADQKLNPADSVSLVGAGVVSA